MPWYQQILPCLLESVWNTNVPQSRVLIHIYPQKGWYCVNCFCQLIHHNASIALLCCVDMWIVLTKVRSFICKKNDETYHKDINRLSLWGLFVIVSTIINIHWNFNTLRPGQNCRHIADNMFECILMWLYIKISPKFVSNTLMEKRKCTSQKMKLNCKPEVSHNEIFHKVSLPTPHPPGVYHDVAAR